MTHCEFCKVEDAKKILFPYLEHGTTKYYCKDCEHELLDEGCC